MKNSGNKEVFFYRWLGEVAEGSENRFIIASKRAEYVLRVLDGDVSSLPSEILQSNSLVLRPDGKMILASTITTTNNLQSVTSSISLQGMNIAEPSESIEINKLTVPINNCGGSAKISQKYTQTQSFVRQMSSEATASIGGEIPVVVWLKLVAELQIKYGFEQGQIDSRTIEYEMSAEPETNVVYTITWQEIWQKGFADLKSGSTEVKVPFRIKSNLIYSIDSSKESCN